MEETKFDRTPYLESHPLQGQPLAETARLDKTPSKLEDSATLPEDVKEDGHHHSPLRTSVTNASVHQDENGSQENKMTYAARLKPIQSQNLRNKNFLGTLMIRPLILLFFPIIAYAGFLYGANIVWLSVLNATESLVFYNNPYNMSSSTVGLTFIAPLVGTTLA